MQMVALHHVTKCVDNCSAISQLASWLLSYGVLVVQYISKATTMSLFSILLYTYTRAAQMVGLVGLGPHHF